MNRALSVAMAAVMLVPASLLSQTASSPRLALITTIGGTSIPDALGAKCGRNGGGAAGAIAMSAGAVLRPWRLLVLQADVRSAHSPVVGCNLVLFNVDTSYNSDGGFPLVSSTVRIGIETPRAPSTAPRAGLHARERAGERDTPGRRTARDHGAPELVRDSRGDGVVIA